MKPKPHRPKTRREYCDGKLELVPEFSATVDPRVETHVCACVSKDQLTWFRSFLRRHGFKVHQSHRNPSGSWTYSFIAPFPRMDQRWHAVYRDLFEAKVKMVGDLD